MQLKQGHEKVLILVKALPHVGDNHGETVCCAGITQDRQWRRLFPIPFRRLTDSKFSRWNWIEFDWRTAAPKDQRKESRRVQEDTIKVLDSLAPAHRARFVSPIVTASVEEAASKGHTLTLIRPENVRLNPIRKSSEKISLERRAYAYAAAQTSFLQDQQRPLDPCPFEFVFFYDTSDGKSHRSTCDDWETSAMFYRFNRMYGEVEALRLMKETFEQQYMRDGVAFALGTHSQRPKQWLLVGVLRLDIEKQLPLI